MSKKDAAQPDPMGNILSTDVDRLLEQTSELAAKASQEIGVPDGRKPADPKDPPQGSKKPGADTSDIDAQLAELETMLESTLGPTAKAAAPAREPGASVTTSKDSAQPGVNPTAEGEVSADAKAATVAPPNIEGIEDFDISVDLSDHTEFADQEIAEKLALSRPNEQPNAGSPAPEERLSLAGRIADAPFRGLEWLIVAIDQPFAGLSPQTKQLIGYIAVATIIVAVGGLVFGSFARH